MLCIKTATNVRSFEVKINRMCYSFIFYFLSFPCLLNIFFSSTLFSIRTLFYFIFSFLLFIHDFYVLRKH